MRKYEKIIMMIILVSSLFAASCASRAEKGENKATNMEFSSILGKSWELLEVKDASSETVIDRAGKEGVYTITFAEDGIAYGKGSPNNYRAPYTLTENNGITFSRIAGTLMAPLFEPDGLKERQYYVYLEKTTRWEISNGQLQLFTADDFGEVILTFNEISY